MCIEVMSGAVRDFEMTVGLRMEFQGVLPT